MFKRKILIEHLGSSFSTSTLQPILRWSHHRSRYCNAPAPLMIIILIFVTSPTRAWLTATATRLCIGCSLTDISKRKKHSAVDYRVAVSHQVRIARLIENFLLTVGERRGKIHIPEHTRSVFQGCSQQPEGLKAFQPYRSRYFAATCNKNIYNTHN